MAVLLHYVACVFLKIPSGVHFEYPLGPVAFVSNFLLKSGVTAALTP